MTSQDESKLLAAIQHRAEGRYDEARALFQELLLAAPEDGRVHYHYAWLHDTLGEERAAVPYYEKAIALGLPAEDLRGALLGLGSTYRTLGEYDNAIKTLRRGQETFPDGHEFAVFLAMALYNVGQHAEAMRLLLQALAETSAHPQVQRYQRAILFYSDRLDQVWE